MELFNCIARVEVLSVRVVEAVLINDPIVNPFNVGTEVVARIVLA